MKSKRFGILAIGMALVGCATSNLPTGARLVGGGLSIHYDAPSDGTAILRERTSGRIVATRSLSDGDTFSFDPSSSGTDADREVVFSMFAPTNAIPTPGLTQVPTNTFFQLYFVPVKAKRE